MNWYKLKCLGEIIGIFAMIIGMIIIKATWYFELGQVVAGLGIIMFLANKILLPDLLHDIEWSKD